MLVQGRPKVLRVRSRQTLARKGDPIKEVFIPKTAVLTAAVPLGPDRCLDIAFFGPGDIAGSTVAVGGLVHPHDIVVRLGGQLVAVPIELLASPNVATTLLAAHRETLDQCIWTAGMVSTASVDKQVAFWVSKVSALVNGAPLVVSHDDIAKSLNARRAGVSTALALLEGEKLLRSTRMLIKVLDRAGLAEYAAAI